MNEVKLIADSLAPSGSRITTLQLKYPRFIHSEFMTHRVFSRNASSSRAIPVKKMLEDIRNNWARPLRYLKNQKGMQGGDPFSSKEQKELETVWYEAMIMAAVSAEKMMDLGAHKQYANRLLEPFSYISVVVTSTEWDNFLALRHHFMAQPEIEDLAKRIYIVLQRSTPRPLLQGEWHLPYVDDRCKIECTDYLNNVDCTVDDIWIKRSVAKCARVSYLNHGGKTSTVDEDLKLYDRLLGAQPIHASPAEHQAMAVGDPRIQSGNFRGWIQYRKTLKGENVTNFEPGKFD